jgi:hypothetical protein
VSVCVPGCALCELSATVLIGFVCVRGWPLCFFGGGRTGDVVSVSLSRVRVRGPFVRFVILFRDVTADPYLIPVKFVPQVSTHDMRCAGCVSPYSFSLSLSLSRLALAMLSGLLAYWFRRSCTPSARIPYVMTSVISLLPFRFRLTCYVQRDAI